MLATISDLGSFPVRELSGLAGGGLMAGLAAAAGTVTALASSEPVERASLDILEDVEVFKQAIASVRVVKIRDNVATERDDWLRKSFPGHLSFEFAEDDTSAVSTVDRDFNVLVMAGNDITRMRQFITQNQAILMNRVKICLMRASNARRRAQALMAGFDDVFDLGRTRPLEASVRTFAIWNRYQIAQTHNNAHAALQLALRSVCKPDRITPRQQRCLEGLVEANGKLVGYRQLCDRIGAGEAPISDANLKVIICHLRKQLLPGCSIRAEHGVGYRLIVEPKAKPEEPHR
ncbi:MAG: hypothetical protein RIQ46_587 [Pseudomonadota bacterium]